MRIGSHPKERYAGAFPLNYQRNQSEVYMCKETTIENMLSDLCECECCEQANPHDYEDEVATMFTKDVYMKAMSNLCGLVTDENKHLLDVAFDSAAILVSRSVSCNISRITGKVMCELEISPQDEDSSDSIYDVMSYMSVDTECSGSGMIQESIVNGPGSPFDAENVSAFSAFMAESVRVLLCHAYCFGDDSCAFISSTEDHGNGFFAFNIEVDAVAE